jgi:hypothetical protein
VLNKSERWISGFKLIFIIFSSIGLFTHCAPGLKSKIPDISSLTPEAIQARVNQNYQKLSNFEGQARVIIELPGAGYNGYSDVYVKMPDSVLVKTEAILGIDIGVLFFDHQYFGAYAPKENSFYYGEIDILDLRDFLQVELKTEELYEVLTGLTQIDVDSSSRLKFDDGKFLITTLWPQGEVRYWIDPKKYIVTRCYLVNEDGETILKKEFSRFKKYDGLVLPRTIRLTRPKAKERLTVYYTKQKINSPISPEKFKLKIPKNAKRIYWGDLSRPRIERERLKHTK